MNRGSTLVLLLVGIVLAFSLFGCSVSDDPPPVPEPSGAQPTVESPPSGENDHIEQTPADESKRDVPDAISISLTVDGHSFTASLEDNETTQVFAELLPLTLNMSELNGNEKFYYMDTPLPTNPENPGQINAGDLMLYGNNCLVLFFDSFSTSYSYTRLGHVDDASSLIDILDSGTVTITFGKEI